MHISISHHVVLCQYKSAFSVPIKPFVSLSLSVGRDSKTATKDQRQRTSAANLIPLQGPYVPPPNPKEIPFNSQQQGTV